MLSRGWRIQPRYRNGTKCACSHHADYAVVARANRLELDAGQAWVRYRAMDSRECRRLTAKALWYLCVGIHGGPPFAPIGLELSNAWVSRLGAGPCASSLLCGG